MYFENEKQQSIALSVRRMHVYLQSSYECNTFSCVQCSPSIIAKRDIAQIRFKRIAIGRKGEDFLEMYSEDP
jgi:hypothetical protein